jgi:hypothetical protein
MDGRSAPSPPKVWGSMLAHYRLRTHLTPEGFAAKAFISGSLARKLEAGTRTPSEDLAKVSDDLLGAGGALTELYDQLSPAFRERSYPTWFGRWPDIEAAARSLRTFEPVIVPGLLQTERYARAVLSTRVGDTPDEIDELVAARMRRQEILACEDPPTLWAIFDEQCLRRCVGGAETMREQCAHLCEMAVRPGVVMRVIPLSTGVHQGLNGAGFVIADLSGGSQVAYQDTAVSGQVIEDDGDIEALRLTWDTLLSEALPRTATLEILQEAEGTWTS